MTRQRLDGLLCAGSALFYLLNRFYLKSAVGGWFLRCYANDVFAGLALVAWLNLVLSLARWRRVDSWRQTVPFLLFCGLVWEVWMPLFKASAVFDPWDFLAYQAGGFCYLLLLRAAGSLRRRAG